MPKVFHRLTENPAGYDAFPSGYDFINDPGANGDPGQPALVYGDPTDFKSQSGPNQGTYFWGFGEDATSGAMNRASRALSVNTDTLDNYLRRPLAVPKELIGSTGLVSEAQVLLPEASGVYLGLSNQRIDEDVSRLFLILDDEDNELIEPISGVRVVAVDVTGGTLGTGFAPAQITVNVNPAIPASTNYKVRYAVKSNLSVTEVGSLMNLAVPYASEAPAVLENLIRLLRSPASVNERWNDQPFKSTLYELAQGGLWERYSRRTGSYNAPNGGVYPATDLPVELQEFWSDAFDTPGAGSLILRTGHAPTVISNKSSPYLDPIDAMWTAYNLDGLYGGSSGFVYYGAQHPESEVGAKARGFASFLHVAPHWGSGWGAGPYTNLPDGTSGTIALNGSVYELTVTGGAYFHGEDSTSVAPGYDLLELQYQSGVRKTVVIRSLVSATKCTVASVPAVVVEEGDVTIRWLSLLFMVGDGTKSYSDYKPTGFFYSVMRPQKQSDLMVGASGDGFIGPYARFFGEDTGRRPALAWGGHKTGLPTTGFVEGGYLHADGGAYFSSDVEIVADLTAQNVIADDLESPTLHSQALVIVGTTSVSIGLPNEDGGLLFSYVSTESKATLTTEHAEITGNLDLGGFLACSNSALVQGALTVTGVTTLGVLHASGTTTLGVLHAGSTTVGALTAGATDVTALTVSGNTTHNGATVLNNLVTITNLGHVRKRVVYGVVTTATYGVTSTDTHLGVDIVLLSTNGDDVTYTISNEDAGVGDSILFTAIEDLANTYVLKREDQTVITMLGATLFKKALIVYVGSSWVLAGEW